MRLAQPGMNPNGSKLRSWRTEGASVLTSEGLEKARSVLKAEAARPERADKLPEGQRANIAPRMGRKLDLILPAPPA